MSAVETNTSTFDRFLTNGGGSSASFNIDLCHLDSSETWFVRGIYYNHNMTVKIIKITPHEDGYREYDFNVISVYYSDIKGRMVDHPQGWLWEWFGIL